MGVKVWPWDRRITWELVRNAKMITSHPRATESGTVGVRTRNLCFNNLSRGLWYTPNSERHQTRQKETKGKHSSFPHVCMCMCVYVYILKISFFLERGEGREKDRERNINVWLPRMHPQLGTWPATQARALTGNWTGNPCVRRPALNPPSHTSQSW